jgi:Tfp pilus assembly protein PilV
MKIIISLLLAIIFLGVIAIHSGVYNMAATEKHWTITEKIIEWVRIRSIAARAENLEVPALDDASILLTGAEHYDAMCTACHLTPDQEPTELASGLYPQAPVFHQRIPITDEENRLEQIKEYFWVIKNGLKMTAMPAWGHSHDDETIWAMAAFVQKLGGMTSEQYIELTNIDDNDNNHSQEHGHGHHHD